MRGCLRPCALCTPPAFTARLRQPTGAPSGTHSRSSWRTQTRSSEQRSTGGCGASAAAMPPKLFLNVNASVRESFAPAVVAAAAAAAEDDGGPAIAALHAPSIEIGPSGTLRLFKSFQAFEFNPLGMKRSGAETAPLASGAAALQSSYKVCRVGCSRVAAN